MKSIRKYNLLFISLIFLFFCSKEKKNQNHNPFSLKTYHPSDTTLAFQNLEKAKKLIHSENIIDSTDFLSALEAYQETEAIYIQTNQDSARFTEIYSLIGTCYAYAADHQNALHYLEKAKAIKESMEEEDLLLADILEQISLIYSDILENHHGVALAYQQKAYAIKEKSLEKYNSNLINTLVHLVKTGGYKDGRQSFLELVEHEEKENAVLNKKESLNLIKLWNAYASILENTSTDYLKEAQAYREKAVTLANQRLDENHPIKILTLNGLGENWWRQGKQQKALDYFLEGVKVGANSNDVRVNIYLDVVMNNAGVGLRSTSDLLGAADLYRQVRQIRERKLPPGHWLLGFTGLTHGRLYKDLGQHDSAFYFVNQAYEIRKLLKKDSMYLRLASVYIALGQVHLAAGKTAEAKEVYLAATKMNRNEISDYYLGTVFNQLGDVYNAEGNIDSARYFMTKGLRLRQSKLKYGESYLSHYNLALLEFADANFETAVQQIDSALLSLNFTNTKELDRVPTLLWLAQVLSKGAGIHLGISKEMKTKSDSLRHLLKADDLNKSAIEVLQEVQKKFWNKKSELQLLDNKYKYFERAIETKYHLSKHYDNKEKYNKAIFELAEMSKDYLLKQNYQKISQEDKSKISLERKAVEKNYEVISVDKVQNQLLSPEQSLVQYFVGHYGVYILVVNQESLHCERVDLDQDFPLGKWVKTLNNSIEEIGFDATIAYELNENLIHPIKDFLPTESQEPRELIIIPDGILAHLSFDVLLSSMPKKDTDFYTFSFLINDYQISYAPSATMLNKMIEKEHLLAPTKTLLAIAPDFQEISEKRNNDNLKLKTKILAQLASREVIGPLHHNKEEVQVIYHQLSGNKDTLCGKSATKENFLQKVSDCRILHISSHAILNDEFSDLSYVAFYHPNRNDPKAELYNREIYDLNLNADMVVLSACNTGLGKIQRGEGVMSISRGFVSAGAKSVITTNWMVRDKTTPKLMEYFYENLVKGQAKDAALRNAKLEYIKKQLPEPLFWAAFKPMGDMRPIVLPKK